MRLSRRRKKLLLKRFAQWEAAQPDLGHGVCRHCPTAHRAPDEGTLATLEWVRTGQMTAQDARLYCPWRQSQCVAMDRLLGVAP